VIVADSSVWIDFINGRDAPHVRRLRATLGADEIVVGDLMLCEADAPFRDRGHGGDAIAAAP
jgi:predicted nucleic acid-binding protein